MIKAHIFGRRKRGDREEVKLQLFNEDDSPLDLSTIEEIVFRPQLQQISPQFVSRAATSAKLTLTGVFHQLPDNPWVGIYSYNGANSEVQAVKISNTKIEATFPSSELTKLQPSPNPNRDYVYLANVKQPWPESSLPTVPPWPYINIGA